MITAEECRKLSKDAAELEKCLQYIESIARQGCGCCIIEFPKGCLNYIRQQLINAGFWCIDLGEFNEGKDYSLYVSW